jgi:hypothetical protein
VCFCKAKRPIKKVPFLGSVFGQAKMEHKEILVVKTLKWVDQISEESIDYSPPTTDQ